MGTGAPETEGASAARCSRRRIAVLLCRARWLVLAFWIAATASALIWLPPIGGNGDAALGTLAPRHASAIQAEAESATAFGFPLLSRTVIVQRDPNGLSAAQQLRAVRLAAELTAHKLRGYKDILGALTVSNALGGPPFSREHSTAVLTYLFFTPHDSAGRRTTIARRLVRQQVSAPAHGVAGVTGEAPAHVEQYEVIKRHLGAVELATVLLVACVLGIRFRSVGAPLLALAAVGVSFVLATRGIAWLGQVLNLAVPQEVEPVMVVLILGVVTDYAVFFLSRFRGFLDAGQSRLAAAEQTTLTVSPIVLVAGLTVAAATAALLIAHLAFFRTFGPGLAETVLICLAVVLTLIPAALACFGAALFWPRVPKRPRGAARARASQARASTISFACQHPWTAVLACLVVIAAGASGLYALRLSNPVVKGLPATASARSAYRAATRAFAPGALSPTVVVVNGRGIAKRREALARLQSLIAAQPGIALVVGPGDNPLRISFHAALAKDGNAARYFVVLNTDPLGAQAISTVRHLQGRMSALLRSAGLPNAKAVYAGDTALSAETINDTLSDLRRTAPAALVAMLVILIIYLRAIVAPLYLIAASMLSFAAALGIGVYVFQGLLGEGGLAFFVPFVAAVLLISLGSDYNVYLIGNIWQEAGRRKLSEAVPIAATRSSRAITLAGLILAASFAVLAIIPLEEFRQIALIMTVGLLIDAMLVRPILVPALVTIVGSRSSWPGRRLDPAMLPQGWQRTYGPRSALESRPRSGRP